MAEEVEISREVASMSEIVAVDDSFALTDRKSGGSAAAVVEASPNADLTLVARIFVVRISRSYND